MKKIIKIYTDSFEGLSRDVWIFASMMFINRLGTLILPFLTLYTTQHLGWTKIAAGTATMWFGIGSLVGAWIGGQLTDRYGYYRTMVIGLFSASVFFYMLQYFSDFYMVCGFLFISSMFADMISPAVMTGVTFFTTKKTQTRAISLIRMAFNLGLAIGPAIAGILIEWYGYNLIFIIDALTCLAAGLFLLAFVKNNHKIEKESLMALVDKGISPYRDVTFYFFMFFNFLMVVSFFQILFTIPLFLTEALGYSESHIGLFFALNGILIFLFEMPIVYYVEKFYSHFKAMMIGATMMGVAILIFVFPLPSLFMIAFYSFFIAIGEIINFPFIASASIDRAAPSRIGQYMGMNTLMFSAALIVAPILGTGILEAFGYSALFATMFGLCMMSVVGLKTIERKFTRAA